MQTLRDLSLSTICTGLYNRRGLFAVSGKRLEIGQRVGCRAFVVFADLDHLKQVNDEHGHAAGDVFLQLAAEAVSRSFRAADVVARVGGDEFVVVGLETTAFEPPCSRAACSRTSSSWLWRTSLPHPVSISCGVERFDSHDGAARHGALHRRRHHVRAEARKKRPGAFFRGLACVGGPGPADGDRRT